MEPNFNRHWQNFRGGWSFLLVKRLLTTYNSHWYSSVIILSSSWFISHQHQEAHFSVIVHLKYNEVNLESQSRHAIPQISIICIKQAICCVPMRGFSVIKVYYRHNFKYHHF